ncbi:transposase-like protein [Parabacteroides sp. PF5-5]|uniref:IS1595 family transposase n=1 Tax=unclassified Parabacteroides TaxID=2649774 RepID=UPI0024747362|nr:MULTISPECIES: IS1595 family transposase [unclassified Parabacteroides]MDH6305179.1 transposase-like protein [Parabacteroides sp. PH5-39]MDH6316529.1 transposase-like protein [Parabacteroides sp. PF5-13]MDH6320039.1 transposase-like protein [Parabacteroides sp. PH5-13]MDH6323728.1 transposase-like protein [Parabacteroides sp. PH5-8]MDH6327716.1 transposase-like protein [Parabacteroides sp. PH5-41]
MFNGEIKDEFNSLIELTDYLRDEMDCIMYLSKKRWGDNTVCPHCGCEKVYSFSDGIRYKCSHCRKQFTVKVGTIFEGSKVSLRKWFIAIYLITSHKKGISSYQLAKDIDVTQKTAWFMLHRIRYALSQADLDIELENDVEIDETYVGGKNKNRHWNKKVKHSQGRSTEDKTPVFGMIERNGKVIAMVVPDVKGKTLKDIIRRMVKDTARIISDEYIGYSGLEKIFRQHVYVQHGAGQYVIGDIYTNTIEGFWSIAKRAIIGIYHCLSPKHLQRYFDEFTFRYNTRKMKEGERVNKMLSLCYVRMTYQNLVYG